GHDHPVPGTEILDLATDLLDHPHRLVTQDVTGIEERAEYLVQVQVRTANARGRHPDHRIGRFHDLRIGDFVHPHVTLSLPGHGLHGVSLACSPGSSVPDRRSSVVACDDDSFVATYHRRPTDK